MSERTVEGLREAIENAATSALSTVANGFGGDLSYFDDGEIAVTPEVARAITEYLGVSRAHTATARDPDHPFSERAIAELCDAISLLLEAGRE